MRKLRLREYLLLITMATLLTSAFAIRTRTASDISAGEHASRAQAARLTAVWCEDQFEGWKSTVGSVTDPAIRARVHAHLKSVQALHVKSIAEAAREEALGRHDLEFVPTVIDVRHFFGAPRPDGEARE